MQLQAQLFFFTLVLITQPVLILLKQNGNKLPLWWKKIVWFPILIRLIKVLLLAILKKMLGLLDISLSKVSKWLLLNHSLKIWVFMEKESELFILLPVIRTPAKKFFPKLSKAYSNFRIIIRKKYSNPPLHGALVAQTILNDPKLFESWRTELKDIVAQRIIEMRKALRS